MEVPGIAAFTGQPTLTSPPDAETRQVGRVSAPLQSVETTQTVTAQAQPATTTDLTTVVNATEQPAPTGFDLNNPGGTIDLTV
ncbi:hypothetical protein Q7C_1974 [Methylophaga frappieri]|jgi:hypothetical protein|uniref:Uncharacterized protein n=1 Tax=Methylophaga frappieri (strain ATCC BAA-2434 / DSM 25690 / JAM7) TaxID=754477 RepID=I1YJM1_METFJ|nr:hypothetical protein [Methylophaga frappieri]AFJ03114.1 hypothetical protein Q7C_1974 [Methylophaga frappieri]